MWKLLYLLISSNCLYFWLDKCQNLKKKTVTPIFFHFILCSSFMCKSWESFNKFWINFMCENGIPLQIVCVFGRICAKILKKRRWHPYFFISFYARLSCANYEKVSMNSKLISCVKMAFIFKFLQIMCVFGRICTKSLKKKHDDTHIF